MASIAKVEIPKFHLRALDSETQVVCKVRGERSVVRAHGAASFARSSRSGIADRFKRIQFCTTT